MFEITGEDVARLGDTDLRTLVARLALAELSAQGLACSAVTAGGHQDAKDGGIDVRVETDADMPRPDFVPRKLTGFQVKRPDMPRSEIINEMRPGLANQLRPSIERLAQRGGAYILVSAQGSVADQPLQDRRQALRDGLEGCADADRLHTDFYDRERLAAWTNRYPGAAAWLRQRIGAPLSGWRTIGSWSGVGIAEGHGYIVSEHASVMAEGSQAREALTIAEALDALRARLAAPAQAVRLIGLSGVGKTRFVEALFEAGVGEAPALDPALSVYTDFAEDVEPSAREMARRLVEAGQRAILVVDNCTPTVHADLAMICTVAGSQVSLLTVEYDVRDDEPERTEVFRLTNTSPEAVELWLRREFPHISQVDRRTIAGSSDGNFRVARALADTLRRGDSLGSLRNNDLFERLFFQRNVPDRRLLRDAEVLALVYSFDGADHEPSGELAALGALAGRDVRELFETGGELRARGIIQARGRWRAILPQAIANRLAASGLQRILPRVFDDFARSASTRLLKSLTRRLGYLHDSEEARAAVERWIDPSGVLGNLLQADEVGIDLAWHLAPMAPEAMLAALQAELDGPRGAALIATTNRHRSRWARLIRALAYSPQTFERAALLLARFAAAGPEDHNTDSARSPFTELFHIQLSGTRATPDQRVWVIRELLQANDEAQRRAGRIALRGLLKTRRFSSSTSFDFGARPRDFGWHPSTQDEIDRWFTNAIALALNGSLSLGDAKTVLGQNARGLWGIEGARAALEAAAERFISETGGWVDGWLGLRAYRRFDEGENVDRRTIDLIDRLKPVNLLERARAIVLSRRTSGIDVSDLEDANPADAWRRTSAMAVDIGKEMAAEDTALAEFLPEVVGQQAHRAYELGRGLAIGTLDPRATWRLLSDAYNQASPTSRYATSLGGFLAELSRVDRSLADEFLDEALDDRALRDRLPFLQSRVRLDAPGLDRLRRLAEVNGAPTWTFRELASGVIDDAEAMPLIPLLDAIGALLDGPEIVLDILHMKLRYAREEGQEPSAELLAYGRQLLLAFKVGSSNQMRDYRLGELVELCFAGDDHKDDVRAFCQRFLEAVRSYEIYAFDSHGLVAALFKTHPFTALDCLIDEVGDGEINDEMFEVSTARRSAIDTVAPEILIQWANVAPERRFPKLGAVLPIFSIENLDDVVGLSTLFVTTLRHAPDKTLFLDDCQDRLRPNGWSGSLASNLVRRKEVLAGFTDLGDAEVDRWLAETNRVKDSWIEAERGREKAEEESFE